MSIQSSTPYLPRDPRLYTDRILRATADFSNWDPLKKIQVGDYGTVNQETGVFDIEGNVYEDFLDPDQVESYQRILEDPEDSYVANSKEVTRNDIDSKSEMDVPGLAEASIKGEWEFHGDRDALLVMYRPQKTSIPRSLLDYLEGNTIFEDKSVVTSLYSCSGYFFFLGDGKNSKVKLGLRTEDVDGKVSTGWWQEHDKGIHKSGFNPDGHPIFVPLFNLKIIAVIRTRYRDSPFPELEDRWITTPRPWNILHVDGEAWEETLSDLDS